MSIELYNNDENAFLRKLIKKFEYFNSCDFNYHLLNDSEMKKLVDLMTEEICLLLEIDAPALMQTKRILSLHQKELQPSCLPRFNRIK